MTTTPNLGMTEPLVGGDSDTWGGELNADLVLLDAFAGKLLPGDEVDVASASTCDIGAAISPAVRITGTTSISSFGTATNTIRFVRFAGQGRVNHNATSLVLLGAVDRFTAPNDKAIYISDASGNWREHAYFPAHTDPSATGYQQRWALKGTQNTSTVTYLQIPVSITNTRNAVKVSVFAYNDDAATGYCSEYSEWIVNYGSNGGAYLTPTATRTVQDQETVNNAVANISATVSASIGGGNLSIKVTLSFSGASAPTTGNVTVKAEALGPNMDNIIVAV